MLSAPFRSLVASASAALIAAGSPLAAESCSLALSFGLDISVSVDPEEYRLQREGLAAALSDPEVAQLIESQPGGVALMAYEWSGEHQQSVVVPWQLVETEAGVRRFAQRLVDYPPISHFYPTALGRAVGFGLIALDQQTQCDRLVLDMSGDGANNDGYPPKSAYRYFPVTNVTVNGLVVRGSDDEVLRYYAENLIYGQGAFVEVADGFEDYERAMKRKLLREIGVAMVAQN